MLCEACDKLYHMTALRPDMWQRLAYKIGPGEFLLHDDFYDDETGMPYQPEADIDEDQYRRYAIDRESNRSTPDGYCIDFFTRHLVWDNDKEALPGDWVDPLVAICSEKIDGEGASDAVRARAYHLLSWLPKSALVGEFVTDRWHRDREAAWFGIYKAALAHLAKTEAIDMIKNALLVMQPEAYFHDYIVALAGAGCREAIPALREVVIQREPPLLDELGAYYRCLNPAWEDIEADIESGRPMSILAIDSLWIESGNQYKTWFKGRNLVPLELPAARCEELLRKYAGTDKAPRVQEAIERAIQCLK